MPMSSISPSHNEPPMCAQRLSSDMRQFVVRTNESSAKRACSPPAKQPAACKAPKRRAHLYVGRQQPAHSCSLLLLARPETKADYVQGSTKDNNPVIELHIQGTRTKANTVVICSWASLVLARSSSTHLPPNLLMHIHGSTASP